MDGDLPLELVDLSKLAVEAALCIYLAVIRESVPVVGALNGACKSICARMAKCVVIVSEYRFAKRLRCGNADIVKVTALCKGTLVVSI